MRCWNSIVFFSQLLPYWLSSAVLCVHTVQKAFRIIKYCTCIIIWYIHLIL